MYTSFRAGFNAIILISCFAIFAPVPARAADISMFMFPKHGDQAAVSDFMEAINLSTALGSKSFVISKRWNELEPQVDQFELDKLRDDLKLGYDRGWDMYLEIQPINTVKREMPAELQTADWTDPRVIVQLDKTLKKLKEFPTMGSVRHLLIGNEVDVYFAAHPDELDDYLMFYESAAELIRKTFPDATPGITVTFDGTRDPVRLAMIQKIIQKVPVVSFTYYPVLDLVAQPVDQVPAHLDKMIQLAGDKPIILQEVGFPSSPAVQSSEAMQAAFFTTFLTEIQKRPQFKMASIFLLHDLGENYCNTFDQYYGFSQASTALRQQFHAFLCSLGLRNVDGTPKPAWGVVESMLKSQN